MFDFLWLDYDALVCFTCFVCWFGWFCLLALLVFEIGVVWMVVSMNGVRFVVYRDCELGVWIVSWFIVVGCLVSGLGVCGWCCYLIWELRLWGWYKTGFGCFGVVVCLFVFWFWCLFWWCFGLDVNVLFYLFCWCLLCLFCNFYCLRICCVCWCGYFGFWFNVDAGFGCWCGIVMRLV